MQAIIEERSLHNMAMELSGIIKSDQPWPDYIKSPYKYVKYQTYENNMRTWDAYLWDLTGAVIDFNEAFSTISTDHDGTEYPPDGDLCMILSVYLNPTYDSDYIIINDDILKKYGDGMFFGYYAIIIWISEKIIALSQPQQLPLLSQKIEKIYCINGFNKAIAEYGIYEPISIETRIFWWNIAMKYGYRGNIGRRVPFWYNSSYESYQERCRNGDTSTATDMVPYSALTEGTPEEIETFLKQSIWSPGIIIDDVSSIKVTKRGIKIPLRYDDFDSNKIYMLFAIRCQFLTSDEIINICKIVPIHLTNFIHYISDYPDIEISLMPTGVKGKLHLVVSNGNDSHIFNGQNILPYLSRIKPWKAKYINMISDVASTTKLLGESVPQYIFNIHSSIRSIINGHSWVCLSNYCLISEDITFHEYDELCQMHNTRYEQHSPSRYMHNELHYKHIVTMAKQQKKMAMMLANRLELLTDLAIIIREYIA